jgi:hypothetical protein
MARLDDKDLWFGFPDLLDGLIWRFEAEILELLGKLWAASQSRTCRRSSIIEAWWKDLTVASLMVRTIRSA